ncbi:type I restriction-modification enzyme R subunit C-terminal domain-containing protein [Asticcacaulis sp. AND118]|uniref:type I restriction-modification enzyme R subunit C-terminal domain-containing protein n=1 Tax=Asticcacaulis sp. AND118 TaxID=2840468 RepID=UPI001CFFA4A8|nr:type I restriction-modification enzyme R subunit C-terminal domain-containing protein [Asticcacaulis sp. AND118]UDF03272.1 hypothetical protein LH365_12630 [Asticcacaulis sp. AND118]
MTRTETESETRADRIDPVLRAAGWGVVEGSRVRREVICPGRILSGNKRGKGLACDYVLIYRGHKLAVIEAKRAGLSHREGVGQAKDYAERLASTIDEYVYDGSDELVSGEVEEGDRFSELDFNTRIVIEQRELSRVKEFMAQINQRQKTLVFCATQDHAALIRDLINQVKTSTHPDYCHRVTANDGAVGEAHLRAFQDNDKTIPTILTTSQKLSTGVDARNVRHIVLMRPVKSMIEFKQIIGRGTRTFEDKAFFTIWDFVKAHENFRDPEWDGEPLEPVAPEPRGPRGPAEPGPDEPLGGGDDGEDIGAAEKIIIRLADGKDRHIRYISTTTYWGPDGRPMTAAEFLQRLFGDLSGMIPDEDALRAAWSNPDRREQFLEQLSDRGYDHDKLDDMRRLIDAKDSDLFDVLAYILFTNPPVTRHQRAKTTETLGLGAVDGELKDLLVSILRAYETNGEGELGAKKLGNYLIARYGSVAEGKARLGALSGIKAAYIRLQETLYSI